MSGSDSPIRIGAGTFSFNAGNTYADLTTLSGGSCGGTGVINGSITIAVRAPKVYETISVGRLRPLAPSPQPI